QDRLELSPPPRDSRFHRADGDLERKRDLLVAPFFQISQNDRHAELRRQELQRLGHEPARLSRPSVLFRTRRAAPGLGRAFLVPASGKDPPEPGEGPVSVLYGGGRDRREPGAGRSLSAKGCQPPIRLQENILGEIVRLLLP